MEKQRDFLKVKLAGFFIPRQGVGLGDFEPQFRAAPAVTLKIIISAGTFYDFLLDRQFSLGWWYLLYRVAIEGNMK